jgi:hypothetical protein
VTELVPMGLCTLPESEIITQNFSSSFLQTFSCFPSSVKTSSLCFLSFELWWFYKEACIRRERERDRESLMWVNPWVKIRKDFLLQMEDKYEYKYKTVVEKVCMYTCVPSNERICV